MSFVLLDDQMVSLVITGVDDAGNQVPAQLDAPAAWSSSDESVVTVESDPSDPAGATGLAVAVGKVGTATLTVTGTGGGGAIPLSATFDVEVAVSAEVNFAVVPGTPEHKA